MATDSTLELFRQKVREYKQFQRRQEAAMEVAKIADLVIKNQATLDDLKQVVDEYNAAA